MIDNLNEINRILVIVNRLSQSKKGALESSVIKFCKEFVIRGTFPNHQETVDFCIAAGIVKRLGSRVRLTETGEKLLTLNPEHKYELNENQKEFFVQNCLLIGNLSSMTNQTLSQFVPSYSSKTYQWSSNDNVPLTTNLEFRDLLRQSGLLRNVGEILSVDHTYVPDVRNLLKPPGFLTLDQLVLRLKNAEEIGNIAEDIAFKFERQRLKNAGLLVESECIQKTSELNVAAGYDISSFDGKSPNIIYDRFIEVKGSTGKKISFYWSRNEIDRAKVLGREYWIYFIRGIDRTKKTSGTEPILIRDPYKNILRNDKFTVKWEQMVVIEQ